MREILGDPEAAYARREAATQAKRAPKPINMEELIDAFTKGYKSRGESGYYGHVSQSWREHFGTVDAAKVTRAMVEDYRDSLRRQEYGDSTIREYVGALGTMYRWAKERPLLVDDSVLGWSRKGEGVKRRSEPDREVEVLTRDEETKLLQAADEQDRTLIRLYIESGMRLGADGEGNEGLRLRWGHVDRAGGAILIDKSKTGKARSIPLNARLTAVLDDATKHLRSDVLRKQIAEGKAPDAYVLCDEHGQPLDDDIIRRRLESALERAGIVKKGGPFTLMRHTFGSRLAEQGNSMATIATIMGNSEAVCFRHYIRFSPGHLRAAMATLDGTTGAPQTAPGMDEKSAPMGGA